MSMDHSWFTWQYDWSDQSMLSLFWYYSVNVQYLLSVGSKYDDNITFLILSSNRSLCLYRIVLTVFLSINLALSNSTYSIGYYINLNSLARLSTMVYAYLWSPNATNPNIPESLNRSFWLDTLSKQCVLFMRFLVHLLCIPLPGPPVEKLDDDPNIY